MTIDDAIVAFEQVASGDFDSLELDVRDYERLVKWLTELKLARESAFSDIGLAARAVSENHQLKAENEKLRELSKWAILCSEGGVRCEACPYHDKTREPHIFCTMRKAARELGIEVPE